VKEGFAGGSVSPSQGAAGYLARLGWECAHPGDTALAWVTTGEPAATWEVAMRSLDVCEDSGYAVGTQRIREVRAPIDPRHEGLECVRELDERLGTRLWPWLHPGRPGAPVGGSSNVEVVGTVGFEPTRASILSGAPHAYWATSPGISITRALPSSSCGDACGSALGGGLRSWTYGGPMAGASSRRPVGGLQHRCPQPRQSHAGRRDLTPWRCPARTTRGLQRIADQADPALMILPSESPPRLEMMGRLFDHVRDALELWNDSFFHDFFGE
jgi:hypothetical protein